MLRREVIKMGGSLFGLGKGTPSRFPYPNRPQPSPGVSPSQGIVTRANSVIVFGPSGTPVGLFLYQAGTTPALGNLPVAWVSEATKDPFGNVLPSGTKDFVSYDKANGILAWLTAAVLNLKLATDFSAGAIFVAASGQLNLTSPLVTALDVPAQLKFISKLSPNGNGAQGQLQLPAGTVFGGPTPFIGGINVAGGAKTDTLNATGNFTSTGGTTSTPAVASTAGMAGTLPITQTDITEITNALATQVTMTKTWAIPANDAQVGTVYRLTCGGWGVQAGTAAVGLTVNTLAFTHVFAGNAMSAATIPAGATFHWKYEVDLIIVTTGAAGTARASGKFTWNQATTPGANETVALGQTSSSDIAGCDTTSAQSMRCTMTWASITNAPTITCMYSTFERLGG